MESMERKRGHAVAQLVEALSSKPEGRRFDSPMVPPKYGPGFDSASKRNEHQEYFLWGKGDRCVELTTLPHSCTDCLEIWEPLDSSGRVINLYKDCFTFTAVQK